MDSKTFNTTIATSMGEDRKLIDKLSEAFTALMRDAVKSSTSIAIPSFGTFATKKVDEEIITDRVTGHRMMLPPQITVEFQPAAMLRKKLAAHE